MKNCEKRHAYSKRRRCTAPPASVRLRLWLTVFGHQSDCISTLTKSKEEKAAFDFAVYLPTSALRVNASGVTLSRAPTMNPDKLFDYLDGRLPAAERAELEEQLISDRQLQRELAIARQIYAGMGGDSREVFLST